MIPSTNQRVANSTSDEVNDQIRFEMEQRLAHYRYASPHAIQCRLQELDQEWDTDFVTLTYRVRDGETVVREYAVPLPWSGLGLDDLAEEAGAAGLVCTPLAPDFAVLRSTTPREEDS